jgi:hypothetical protein
MFSSEPRRMTSTVYTVVKQFVVLFLRVARFSTPLSRVTMVHSPPSMASATHPPPPPTCIITCIIRNCLLTSCRFKQQAAHLLPNHGSSPHGQRKERQSRRCRRCSVAHCRRAATIHSSLVIPTCSPRRSHIKLSTREYSPTACSFLHRRAASSKRAGRCSPQSLCRRVLAAVVRR